MKRSQRLQVIVDLKANEEKKQLEVLAREQAKKVQKEAQLQSLKAYQQDYFQQNKAKMKSGISVLQLLEFREFIAKMDQAIDGEEQGLQEINSAVTRLKKEWETAHFSTQNMQKIQLKARKTEIALVEKKEQLEMDEHAARLSIKGGINNAL